MLSKLRPVTVPFLALLLGCGGRDTGSSPSPSDGVVGDSSASDAMAPSDAVAPNDATSALPDGGHIVPSGISTKAGDCQSSADCTVGNSGNPQCAEVIPGGYRVCVYQAPIVTTTSMNPIDQCDGTRPCASGACYAALQYPSGQCGLGGVSPRNMCLSDKCASDSDCPDGICGPRGLTSDNNVTGGFVRQCLQADCHLNADCKAHPQGVCALVAGGCPNTPGFRLFHPAQLACVYPDGCFSNADCKQGSCMVIGGSAVCVAPQ
jgi:hypothetical protein